MSQQDLKKILMVGGNVELGGKTYALDRGLLQPGDTYIGHSKRGAIVLTVKWISEEQWICPQESGPILRVGECIKVKRVS